MATRSFASFNAGLVVAGGTGFNGAAALSMYMVLKPKSQPGTSRPYINFNNAGNRIFGIWNDAADSNFYLSDNASSIKFSLAPTLDQWAGIGVSFNDGSGGTARGHYYNGTTWSHNNSGTSPNIAATTVDNISFCNAPSGATTFDWWRDIDGLAAAAVYSTNLSDANYVTIGPSASAMLAMSGCLGMWLFNQDPKANVNDNLGNWDQSNEQDTAVVTGDDPSWFDFNLTPPAGFDPRLASFFAMMP